MKKKELQDGSGNAKLILIGGGSGAGKTTIARLIRDEMIGQSSILLSLDNFYSDLSRLSPEALDKYNFDRPLALDKKELLKCVLGLMHGNPVHVPHYDYQSHTRSKERTTMMPEPVLIVEGIFALHFLELLAMADLRIFIDCAPDIRLVRRIRRDNEERGLFVKDILTQYLDTVRPMHLKLIEPMRQKADLVLSGDMPLKDMSKYLKKNHSGLFEKFS